MRHILTRSLPSTLIAAALMVATSGIAQADTYQYNNTNGGYQTPTSTSLPSNGSMGNANLWNWLLPYLSQCMGNQFPSSLFGNSSTGNNGSSSVTSNNNAATTVDATIDANSINSSTGNGNGGNSSWPWNQGNQNGTNNGTAVTDVNATINANSVNNTSIGQGGSGNGQGNQSANNQSTAVTSVTANISANSVNDTSINQ